MSKYVIPDKPEMVRKKVKEILNKQKDQSISSQYDHCLRVERTAIHIAKQICKEERIKVEQEIVRISSLLHDCVKPKDMSEAGCLVLTIKTAREIMKQINYPAWRMEKVIQVISLISSKEIKKSETIEAKIVFDANELDGVGATGMFRFFEFCGERRLSIEEAVQLYKERIIETIPLLRTKPGKELAWKRLKIITDGFEAYREENEFLKAIK